jgi:hypothetical protein
MGYSRIYIYTYNYIYISYKLKDTYMVSRCFVFYMGILECINYMVSIGIFND